MKKHGKNCAYSGLPLSERRQLPWPAAQGEDMCVCPPGQVVQVELGRGRLYTYRWDGDEPLEVGDLVLLPGNIVTPEPFTATVARLGSSYTGEMVSILSKEEPGCLHEYCGYGECGGRWMGTMCEIHHNGEGRCQTEGINR